MLKIINTIEPYSFLLGIVAGAVICILGAVAAFIWVRNDTSLVENHDNEYDHYKN